MTTESLLERLRALAAEALPLPGAGDTAGRHRRLFEVGREDLSLAKLAEAHWDAVAILAEAGRAPAPGAIYAVWASEAPGKGLSLEAAPGGYRLHGSKMFCSGAGLVTRALVSVTAPEQLLLEIDLDQPAGAITIDLSQWQTDAFRLTHTGSLQFASAHVDKDAILGPENFSENWYVERPGFWHGACGPAACWAGGAAGLLDYAQASSRSDPHTLAHLAAIHSNVWATRSFLETAGAEIDREPDNIPAARQRALCVRHLVEQACVDTLRRFARAYGPAPLAMHEPTARRYQEIDLFLRQSHAERDLEGLGALLRANPRSATGPVT